MNDLLTIKDLTDKEREKAIPSVKPGRSNFPRACPRASLTISAECSLLMRQRTAFKPKAGRGVVPEI